MRASSVRNGGVIGGERSVAIALSLMLLISGLFLGACFNPSYEAPRCSPLGECPSGLTCVAEVCVKDPSIGAGDPDAGQQPDAPTTPPVDAPVIDAPPVSTVPSCAPRLRNCGGATGADDCCASSLVPGGTFGRNHDLAADNRYPAPGLPATISSFRFDKYEITVGRLRAFVNAMKGTQADPPAVGSGAHPNIPNSGWQSAWTANLPADRAAFLLSLTNCSMTTWTAMPGANENKPANCINWYTALAFCAWDGGFLPTEAEWHYAGSGGNEQRALPWSVPASSLTLDATYASYNCTADGVANCTIADLLSVGSLPKGDGRWGQSDMIGNVGEWTLDVGNALPQPCTDCWAPPPGNMIFRGSGFDNTFDNLRNAYRVVTNPTSRVRNIGARCARPAN